MTKEEKTMEEQLNEDVLAEQAEVQAEVEAKESKKIKRDGTLFTHIPDTKTKLKLT